MRTIDKQALLDNVETMIETLEYDSMRSPGKTKQNVTTLVDLYSLRGLYRKQLAAVKPAPKKAAVEAAE